MHGVILLCEEQKHAGIRIVPDETHIRICDNSNGCVVRSLPSAAEVRTLDSR